MRYWLLSIIYIISASCHANDGNVFDNKSSNRLKCVLILENTTGSVIANIEGGAQKEVLNIGGKKIGCQYELTQNFSTFLAFLDVEQGKNYSFSLGRVPLGSGDTRATVLINGKTDLVLSENRKRDIEKARVKAYEDKVSEEIAEEKRVAAEEKKFQLSLNNKNPQAMYLAAGAYSRNGEASKAREIYEAIISRFQSSAWAVKANDQLNAMSIESGAQQRQRDSQRAGEDNARQERRNCGVRISMCEDRCPSGAARSSCMASCANLCQQF